MTKTGEEATKWATEVAHLPRLPKNKLIPTVLAHQSHWIIQMFTKFAKVLLRHGLILVALMLQYLGRIQEESALYSFCIYEGTPYLCVVAPSPDGFH